MSTEMAEYFVPGLVLGGLLMWVAFSAYLKVRRAIRDFGLRLARLQRTRVGLVEVSPRGRKRARKGVRR